MQVAYGVGASALLGAVWFFGLLGDTYIEDKKAEIAEKAARQQPPRPEYSVYSKPPAQPAPESEEQRLQKNQEAVGIAAGRSPIFDTTLEPGEYTPWFPTAPGDARVWQAWGAVSLIWWDGNREHVVNLRYGEVHDFKEYSEKIRYRNIDSKPFLLKVWVFPQS